MLRCSTWLTVLPCSDHPATDPRCSISFGSLNFAPLADCSGSDSGAGERRFVYPRRKLRVKQPPHVASLAEPRAARETRPGPPPRRVAAFTDAVCCWCRPRCVQRESLVSGSAIPCVNVFFPSRHVSPPHAPLRSAPNAFFFFLINLVWITDTRTHAARWRLDLATSVPNPSVRGSYRLRARFNWNVTLLLIISSPLSHPLLTPNADETDSRLKTWPCCTSVSGVEGRKEKKLNSLERMFYNTCLACGQRQTWSVFRLNRKHLRC